MSQELLSVGQASQWASDYLDRPVTTSNISYLIQYAKIKKYLENKIGRIRDVVAGPDGMLYITTSNRDGRSKVLNDDDKILRVNPARLSEL